MGEEVVAEARETADALEEMGQSTVYCSAEGKLVGLFGVADTVRPDALATVEWLHKHGVRTLMLTGDRRATALAIAGQVGLPAGAVHAQMRPHQKLNMVMSLQEQGETVLMIGDGINDSPALAKADVGIAIGASAPIAVDAADIVLMRNTLWDMVTAIHLSRHVFARIRMNFVWALMYNLIGVPLAAGILYPLIRPMAMPPAVCALSMALSSTTVVFSSLLLKRYMPPVNDSKREK